MTWGEHLGHRLLVRERGVQGDPIQRTLRQMSMSRDGVYLKLEFTIEVPGPEGPVPVTRHEWKLAEQLDLIVCIEPEHEGGETE